MERPAVLCGDSFQKLWLDAIEHLASRQWEAWNLSVHIRSPGLIDQGLHDKIVTFAKDNHIIAPKDVAYTIFPFNQYGGPGTASRLYARYINNFYPRTRHRPHSGWGTYFHRMVNYKTTDSTVNQLENIISAVNMRNTTCRAAYTMVIPRPGGETIRKMGGPCLNYLAVQCTPGRPRGLGLLAVYRNQEFFQRAYGNYWGLCKLLEFLAKETNSSPAALTCIASHAFVAGNKRRLLGFVRGVRNGP